MKHLIQNKRGYTLLEMVVAVAMFAVVFLLITSTYLSLVESQRSVIATQNIQESMKFVFEVVSKEIRTAVKSDDVCFAILPSGYIADLPLKKIFNTARNGSDIIFYFQNRYNECVSYRIVDDGGIGRLAIKRSSTEEYDLYVTPNEINLENLNFNVWDDDIGAFHSRQPYVTLRVDVETAGGKAMHNQRTTLQTSVTSRYYE